jgi:hypothetical protein
MKYIVEIKYWDGWEEDFRVVKENVIADDCIEALKIVMNMYNFEDEDIEEIEIYPY